MAARGVRLTGGELGGRRLAVPPGARPTEGRVREALFSIWRDLLEGARLLDLFAGSGAVAIEAMGRGAVAATMIESDRRALAVLAGNLEATGLAGVVDVRRGRLPDALAELVRRGERFDLVFADPPYAFGGRSGYGELLAAAAPLLEADGELALEHSARAGREQVPDEVGGAGAVTARPLLRRETRRYGESAVSFYRLLAG